MTAIEVPITADGSAFEFSAALNSQLFWFKFSFNPRQQRWIFSLFDADKQPIRQGMAVITGYPVLNRVQDVRKPMGQIVFIDTANTAKPPSFNDLGTRVRMVYNEA